MQRGVERSKALDEHASTPSTPTAWATYPAKGQYDCLHTEQGFAASAILRKGAGQPMEPQPAIRDPPEWRTRPAKPRTDIKGGWATNLSETITGERSSIQVAVTPQE